VFSGRPDPVWDVSDAVANKLVTIWESLPLAGRKAEPAPRHLGYRGCFLRDAKNGEWDAFGRVVVRASSSGVELRVDAARDFERTLVSSAPKGVLPEDLLTGGWSL
jgi:hypothetical protein